MRQKRAICSAHTAIASIAIFLLPAFACAQDVSGVTRGQAAQIVMELRSAPVLTISDLDGFTERGGITQFFFEHGQMRFSIALESAKRAGLHISAKILTLAIRK